MSRFLFGAAASVDLAHDIADNDRRIACPTLVFYGSTGQMAQLFDIPAEWRKRCANVTEASLPGGHFLIDQFPQRVAEILAGFLDRH
jgi:haloacetate dehalogenase